MDDTNNCQGCHAPGTGESARSGPQHDFRHPSNRLPLIPWLVVSVLGLAGLAGWTDSLDLLAVTLFALAVATLLIAAILTHQLMDGPWRPLTWLTVVEAVIYFFNLAILTLLTLGALIVLLFVMAHHLRR